MQIPEIKKLVERYSIQELQKAENAFEEGENAEIEICGVDEGEQFTHVIAAIWILKTMETDGVPFPTALRAYTQKVRTSIS
ncbi:MAG: hypothetical protein ACFCUU_01550 [Cyclobacteriaceae bacterium]